MFDNLSNLQHSENAEGEIFQNFNSSLKRIGQISVGLCNFPKKQHIILIKKKNSFNNSTKFYIN